LTVAGATNSAAAKRVLSPRTNVVSSFIRIGLKRVENRLDLL
jgi:hypothetical protein